MRYIALLRGVNVGGHNQIGMKALCQSLEEAGFEAVSSYINSGNLLFSAAEQATRTLAERCESLLEKEFGLAVSVAVFSAPEWRKALEAAPKAWGHTADCKHNAIFVIEPATCESVLADSGAIKPEYETLTAYGRVLFWSAPLAYFARTRWAKISGTKAYAHITIRNANTARKLLELAEETS